MRATLAASGALLVLAVAYWLGADAIPKSSLGGAVGADGLPKLLAMILAGLSVALAAQTILQSRRASAPGEAESGPDEGTATAWRTHAKALGVIAIGAAFVALLPLVGYAVAIALLLMTVATYSGHRPGIGTVAFGLGGAVFFQILFVHLLQVPLPAGLWMGLFT